MRRESRRYKLSVMAAVRRPGLLLFGLVAYAAFAVALLLAFGFIAGIGPLPGIDRPLSSQPLSAAAIDAGLLALFALQHSVMARPRFKRAFGRILPAGAERSAFVLAASACLLLLFWQWRSLPGTLWEVRGAGGAGLWGLYGLGWLILVSATFMIDHLDLFGLRQAWNAACVREMPPLSFKARWLYAWVRHPLMTGFLVLFWATPRMTWGHLLFAGAASGYIAIGIWFEERELLRAIPEYAGYRRRVGAVLPKLPARG